MSENLLFLRESVLTTEAGNDEVPADLPPHDEVAHGVPGGGFRIDHFVLKLDGINVVRLPGSP